MQVGLLGRQTAKENKHISLFFSFLVYYPKVQAKADRGTVCLEPKTHAKVLGAVSTEQEVGDQQQVLRHGGAQRRLRLGPADAQGLDGWGPMG